MAFKVFVAGAVFTAAEANTYFMEQSNIRCTSGTRPSSPAEGMVIWETDTDLTLVYSGSAWVEMGGYGAWTSYTPALVQSGAVTKTVNYARYRKQGRMITVGIQLDVTGTGTAANQITIELPPFVPVSTNAAFVWGSGYLKDTSATTQYPFRVVPASTTTIKLLSVVGIAANAERYLGAGDFTAALASGDYMSCTFTYESTS